mmetsp:Transcript_581/g.1724  ORF Transcript_581/g.1724 Transcript_581/m.1724 type:complete len:97 (-) Transcript_581:266-556(-)
MERAATAEAEAAEGESTSKGKPKTSALEEQLGLPAGALAKKRLQASIRECIVGKDPASLTARGIRQTLETQLGLAKDALKPQKEVLNKMIDDILAE